MNDESKMTGTQPAPRRVTRRTLVSGTAWAVPVISAATAAPAFAASGGCDLRVKVEGPGDWCTGLNDPQPTFQVWVLNDGPASFHGTFVLHLGQVDGDQTVPSSSVYHNVHDWTWTAETAPLRHRGTWTGDLGSGESTSQATYIFSPVNVGTTRFSAVLEPVGCDTNSANNSFFQDVCITEGGGPQPGDLNLNTYPGGSCSNPATGEWSIPIQVAMTRLVTVSVMIRVSDATVFAGSVPYGWTRSQTSTATELTYTLASPPNGTEIFDTARFTFLVTPSRDVSGCPEVSVFADAVDVFGSHLTDSAQNLTGCCR